MHHRVRTASIVGAGKWRLGFALGAAASSDLVVAIATSSTLSTSIMSIQEHRDPQISSMHGKAVLSMI